MDKIEASNAQFSAQQAAEITALVNREMPQIEAAAQKMLKSMRGLSQPSQKQALLIVLIDWIDSLFDDMADVERFTDLLKYEIDQYVAKGKAERLRQG